MKLIYLKRMQKDENYFLRAVQVKIISRNNFNTISVKIRGK